MGLDRRSATVRTDDGRMTVLESVPALRSTTNPYLHQLIATLREYDDVELFGWRRALLGRYDVFHVHWPELLSRGTSPVRRRAKRALTRAFQWRLRLARIPVVRTAHNLAPHEQADRAERRILERWDRLTTAWIALNAATPLPHDARARLIPHGDYTTYYAGLPTRSPRAGLVVSVGQIRPYKGIDALLTAFADMPPDARLLVAGACFQPGLAQELTARADADDRVELEIGFVDDVRLVDIVTSASLVVLPYTEMHNSGALLLALSLRRPVLTPRNEVTDALAEEVGRGWVHRFDGPAVTAADLERALADGIPAGAPDLSLRDWPTAARAHAEVFREAVAHRGKRGRS